MNTAEWGNMILLDQDLFFIEVFFNVFIILLTNLLTADEDR